MRVGTHPHHELLGEVLAIKQKRSLVRPLVADLKRLDVAVAETGHLDLHRRAEVSCAVVAADAGHCRAVLDRAEQLAASRPELELLSARVRFYGDDA